MGLKPWIPTWERCNLFVCDLPRPSPNPGMFHKSIALVRHSNLVQADTLDCQKTYVCEHERKIRYNFAMVDRDKVQWKIPLFPEEASQKLLESLFSYHADDFTDIFFPSAHLPATTPSVTTHASYWRVSSTLKDPSILLFSLVALSIVLLLFSLSLALIVLLSGARAKTSNPGPKKANHNQDCVVQVGQEVGRPGCQPGQSAKGKCGMDTNQKLQKEQPMSDSGGILS